MLLLPQAGWEPARRTKEEEVARAAGHRFKTIEEELKLKENAESLGAGKVAVKKQPPIQTHRHNIPAGKMMVSIV
ncbi:hypothetical protein BIW11_03105 [Tropilaelaps mercedesae]|uniref:Uncharacterized protein n=1 Tax=Tropilaelaps mercedesae TaxID=418985 RepID=A0A1V9XS28_9ACAR|nr:hypothetical protein BIW11_03105 [Tropilaelaps mercedesae]